MARRTNRIAFKKGMVYEEDGEFFIEEVKRDYTETHSLTQYLRKFMGDEDEPRLVDITVSEVFDIESLGD